MIGETVGSYQLVKELGRGAMGAVYLAEHTLLQRQAAIKILLPALSKDQAMLQRFFDEARAITAIHNPGIVQVFDFGRHTDGSAYLIMELLEGEDLAERLGRLGRLPVVDALRIARQCASALAAAHEVETVHRDLKPDNIYLVTDSEVAGGERAKIVDFGIAKLSDDRRSGLSQTHSGSVLGTPLYMAPEQSRSASEVDHRADIYSLGCVLFHMLCGRPPFLGSGIGDTIASHLFEAPPHVHELVPEVPPAVDALIQRALAKDPADRYATMADMSEAIDALSADLPEGTAGVSRAATTGLGQTPVPTRMQTEVPPASQGRATTAAAATTLGGTAAQSLAQDKSEASGRPGGGLGVLLVSAVVVALSVVGILALNDPAPEPAAVDSDPAEEAISVRIESDPAGASVSMRGQDELLGVTPFVYEAPPAAGEIVLELRLDGFDTEEISFPADLSGVARVSLRKSRRGNRNRRGDRDRRPRRDNGSDTRPASGSDGRSP